MLMPSTEMPLNTWEENGKPQRETCENFLQHGLGFHVPTRWLNLAHLIADSGWSTFLGSNLSELSGVQKYLKIWWWDSFMFDELFLFVWSSFRRRVLSVGAPVPVKTATIHSNKTIKIRSWCFFHVQIRKGWCFLNIRVHWGTPSSICSHHFAFKVKVHAEMPSFSGRPGWTCWKSSITWPRGLPLSSWNK